MKYQLPVWKPVPTVKGGTACSVEAMEPLRQQTGAGEHEQEKQRWSKGQILALHSTAMPQAAATKSQCCPGLQLAVPAQSHIPKGTELCTYKHLSMVDALEQPCSRFDWDKAQRRHQPGGRLSGKEIILPKPGFCALQSLCFYISYLLHQITINERMSRQEWWSTACFCSPEAVCEHCSAKACTQQEIFCPVVHAEPERFRTQFLYLNARWK